MKKIILVTGPAGSGKSEYIKASIGDNDKVVFDCKNALFILENLPRWRKFRTLYIESQTLTEKDFIGLGITNFECIEMPVLRDNTDINNVVCDTTQEPPKLSAHHSYDFDNDRYVRQCTNGDTVNYIPESTERENRRFVAACHAMQGLLANSAHYSTQVIAERSHWLADALIKELDK